MILEKIDSPQDLRELGEEQLAPLCEEVRNYILDCCSRNPGHLASSLGAVEIIVGLHYVLDTPQDEIVFDVGHQAYAHKILTGRREEFRTLRTKEGISGFPNIKESAYDSFGVGHSSTSISAALGMAEAARIRGDRKKVVAVIGDGALAGGLAFEGLNNAGISNSDLLVILNDNNQSIGPNRGGLHDHLLKLTTSKHYNWIKLGIWNLLGEGRLRRFLQRWVRSLKAWFVKRTGGDLFESLGFRYFGPIDGNDIRQVTEILRKLRNIKGPCLLHCMTVKGKGYAPAEADPETWHAPGKFDVATGQRVKTEYGADRYQDVFGAVLCELAESNPDIVGITPAMTGGSGMTGFSQRFPSRFYDVGIEEQHAVTFSAGLAAGGLHPFCNIYSSFSQRAYDQIVHDVALQKLPVVLCFDRAGVVGEDGATHNGVFDMAAYRSIPNCIVAVPSDETELKLMMYSALRHSEGPYIIRYPRGVGEGADWRNAAYEVLTPGRAVELRSGSDVAVIALGPCAHRAVEAAESLEGKLSVGVYDFRYLKPMDTAMLDKIASKYRAVLTVEDGCLKGGLFGAVAEYYASRGTGIRIDGLGVPDEFILHARQSQQRAMCGIDTAGITLKLSALHSSWRG